MMSGIEPFIPKISAFFLGFAEKCIIAAIIKWKEIKDQTAAQHTKRILNEYDLAKAVLTKVEQRI